MNRLHTTLASAATAGALLALGATAATVAGPPDNDLNRPAPMVGAGSLDLTASTLSPQVRARGDVTTTVYQQAFSSPDGSAMTVRLRKVPSGWFQVTLSGGVTALPGHSAACELLQEDSTPLLVAASATSSYRVPYPLSATRVVRVRGDKLVWLQCRGYADGGWGTAPHQPFQVSFTPVGRVVRENWVDLPTTLKRGGS